MIELYVDDQRVDLDEKTNVSITVAISDIEEPNKTKSSYTKTIDVPITIKNRRVFGFTEQIASVLQFNNTKHSARICKNGNTVMSGTALMDRYKLDTSSHSGYYALTVTGATMRWVNNAQSPISEITTSEGVIYTLESVYQNSIAPGTPLIRFIPVDRGGFYTKVGDTYSVRSFLEVGDYHPFVNVYRFMQEVFAGYTIRTSLMETLQSLYFSGVIPEVDNEIADRNKFCVGTTWSDPDDNGADKVLKISGATETAIDLFDLIQSEGDSPAYYANGVLWASDSDTPYTQYQPLDSAVVAFSVTIEYSSTVVKRNIGKDCMVVFADKFHLITRGTYQDPTYTIDLSSIGDIGVITGLVKWDGADGTVEIKPGEDAGALPTVSKPALMYIRIKEEIYTGDALYLKTGVSIFGHDYANSTTLLCNHVTRQGVLVLLPILPKDRVVKSVYLLHNDTPITLSTDIADVWSSEGDLMDISFTFQTEPIHLNAGEIITLGAGFSCPHSTGEFTITPCECTIEPAFPDAIGVGTKVTLATIGGSTKQIDVLAALRQMFNLLFYTNDTTREVFIEPRTTFFKSLSYGNNPSSQGVFDLTFDATFGSNSSGEPQDLENVIDWSDRIDFSKTIEVEELGGDIGGAIKISYNEGNDALKAYNKQTGQTIGEYKETLLNNASTETYELTNNLWAPFVCREIESLGMSLLQNAEEGDPQTLQEVESKITATIGRFSGVASRSSGVDREIYPQYPIFLFQNINAGVNLGFEDRYKVEVMGVGQSITTVIPGLHRYYDSLIRSYNFGRRITAYLHLRPQDVESILFPNDTYRDFRGVYRLAIQGEEMYCRLEKIQDYNPASGESVKCSFIRCVE